MTEGAVLDGVKVLDFSWVAAGPITTRYFAEYGATVVKVESTNRIDMVRRSGPYPGNEPDPDQSGIFCDWNCGKYGITLNLNNPKGLKVVRQLATWADVVVENFVPGTTTKWGLDYRSIKKINPSIIYLSSSTQGQTGPRAKQRAFGFHLASLSGFTELTGYPDRPPSGMFAAYTDSIAPRFSAAAVIAALDHRKRTGKGCRIDYSQVEGAVQFLTPLLLDYTANAHVASRTGNRCEHSAPHGVYPCIGDDRWVAIGVFDDEEWKHLCQAMEMPALAQDTRFSTLQARKQCEDELDKIIAAWTKRYEPRQLMEALQEIGVPAGVVQTYEDLFTDQQLAHRGHHVYLHHDLIGRHAIDSLPFRLSKTPGSPRFPAPRLGEHNEYVLKHVLSYNDDEIADLIASGALD